MVSMRHTFISMFVGKFRSMGEAALQAGNSESIIRKETLGTGQESCLLHDAISREALYHTGAQRVCPRRN
jgi:hypothetical protein